jgi:hypothetical protein
MRIDSYTKTLLTLITLLLAFIAAQQIIRPKGVNTQSQLAGVQFLKTGEYKLIAIDTNTGEIWHHRWAGADKAVLVGRFTKLSEPMSRK